MDFLASQVFTLVDVLSYLTVLGQLIAAAVLALLIMDASAKPTGANRWVSRNALTLMLIVALVASGASLFFSEIAGWTPCKFCWLQRIFMYPQVILLAIALWKRDANVAWYVLALSVLGAAIAGYHLVEQLHAASLPPEQAADAFKPCDASGTSCAYTEFKFAFGYISIPTMALTAFVMNALGSVALMRGKR